MLGGKKSGCLSVKLDCKSSLSFHVLIWELNASSQNTLLTHSNGKTAYGNTALEELKFMAKNLIGFLLSSMEKITLVV